MRRSAFPAAAGIILFACAAFAQQDQPDIPFLWGHAWGAGARSAALGGGSAADADALSALSDNPACLGLVKKTTVSGSFSYLNVSDKSTFLGLETEQSSSFTRMNDFGLSFPVPTERGSLVFSLAYHRPRLFDSNQFAAATAKGNKTDGFPVDGYQTDWENEILEQGALSRTSLGLAVEVAPDAFIGFGFHLWGGSYENTKRFRELDSADRIPNFRDSTSTDHFKDEFSGFNVSFGTLVKFRDKVRLGLAVFSPGTLKASERWDYVDTFAWEDGYSESDSGYSDRPTLTKIRSPWVFRAGLAVIQGPLTVSADGELADYSQSRYLTDPPEADLSQSDANFSIQRNLQNTLNTRVGAELRVLKGLSLRAGYAFCPSAFKSAPTGADRQTYSLGAGFVFLDQFNLDLAFTAGSWKQYPVYQRNVFGNTYLIPESFSVRNILVSFSSRL